MGKKIYKKAVSYLKKYITFNLVSRFLFFVELYKSFKRREKKNN